MDQQTDAEHADHDGADEWQHGDPPVAETLEPRHLAGFALIAVGLIAIDGRLLRRLRGKQPQPAE